MRVGSGCRIGRRASLEASGGTIELAGGCLVGERSRLTARAGSISLGAGVALGECCTLLAHAGIAIGAGSRLGDGVSVIDFDPAVEDSERPLRFQGVRGSRVSLGPDVVLGPRAAIGAGITLMAGARVAAGVIVGGGVPGGRVLPGAGGAANGKGGGDVGATRDDGGNGRAG